MAKSRDSVTYLITDTLMSLFFFTNLKPRQKIYQQPSTHRSPWTNEIPFTEILIPGCPGSCVIVEGEATFPVAAKRRTHSQLVPAKPYAQSPQPHTLMNVHIYVYIGRFIVEGGATFPAAKSRDLGMRLGHGYPEVRGAGFILSF